MKWTTEIDHQSKPCLLLIFSEKHLPRLIEKGMAQIKTWDMRKEQNYRRNRGIKNKKIAQKFCGNTFGNLDGITNSSKKNQNWQ